MCYLMLLLGGDVVKVVVEMLCLFVGVMCGLGVVMWVEMVGGVKGCVWMLGLLLMGVWLKWIVCEQGWNYVYVYSCVDSLNIVMLVEWLGGFSYSLMLYGLMLEGYGLNQWQKWWYVKFVIIILRLLMWVVQQQIGLDLLGFVNLVFMGVDLLQIRCSVLWQFFVFGGLVWIFFCGWLNVVKGYDYLIEMVWQLCEQGIDVYLEIVGEDEQGGSGYCQYFEGIICQKGLVDVVILLGVINEIVVCEVLECVYVFVLVSLNEGILVVIMEVMVMEMFVVVIDVGGNYELIESGCDVVLVLFEQFEVMMQVIVVLVVDFVYVIWLVQVLCVCIVEEFYYCRSVEVVVEGLCEILLGVDVVWCLIV